MAISAPDDEKTSGNIKLDKTDLDWQLWRDLVAFWILGLCNNLGCTVMLSAAQDIIKGFNGEDQSPSSFDVSSTHRDCNIVSTGAVLLACVVPLLIIKTLLPFAPFWVNTRIIASVTLSALGFLLVAYANVHWMAILGVGSTSTARGIGESTLLSLTSRYNRKVISTWSSGTGAAGVIGAVAYAALCGLGMSSEQTMLVMLIFPAIECIDFWLLLRPPVDKDESTEMRNDAAQLKGFKQAMVLLPTLCKYMLPLSIVFFLEYFINQGLYELVHFKNIFLDKEAQYRWLVVDYTLGAFIARSSMNLVYFRKIWIMSVLQFVTTVYFLVEVIYYVTPSIWIVFTIVLVEGLFGGAAYVNTFNWIATDLSESSRRFAIGMSIQTVAVGVLLAGLLAIPTHNAICKLPLPERMTF